MAMDLSDAGTPDEAALGGGADEPEEGKTRRALLKALGVAAAGAVVGGVLSPREAEAHGNLHVDSNNADPAIHGENSSSGPGVQGDSDSGVGVDGSSNSFVGVRGSSNSFAGVAGLSINATGVRGDSNSGVGVEGRAGTGTGVEGHSISGTGVEGSSTSGTGVEGSSATGIGVDGSSGSLIGVNGFSPTGIGVEGRSDSGIGVDGNGGNVGVVGTSESGTGVVAQNFGNGLALNVVGPAKFSTAGSGTIPAGQDSVAVGDTAVTAQSHITATLTGDPGKFTAKVPAVVEWIERQPGIGFVLHLSRIVGSATPFTYLIIEPG